MRVIVTGAAGFIGSHLSEKLVQMGYDVTGIDCFTPYYSKTYKQENLANLLGKRNFQFKQADLTEAKLSDLIREADAVFHLAAQPGVRASWDHFEQYSKHNILATHRLLEALKKRKLVRFIFASSSSVYGEAETYPTPERLPPRPVSPYGVTKAAAERLCQIYHKYHAIPVVTLRYFTVYGPRQRPDMGIYKFIQSMLSALPVEVFGDGSQQRDFTYVSDIIEGTARGIEADVVGEAINLGGGNPVSIKKVLEILSAQTKMHTTMKYKAAPKGEMAKTAADLAKAKRLLRYRPNVELKQGLIKQVEWQRATRSTKPSNPEPATK